MNAKSGLCPEDCGYCSQSKVSEAEIPRYNLLNAEKLLAGARLAAERQAKTYCIVISARGPVAARNGRRHADRPADQVALRSQDLRLPGPAHSRTGRATQSLRRRPGEPQPEHQRVALRRNLLDPHLSGSRGHAPGRATAGMELCSGGIMGMGEQDADVVRMAFALRDLEVESIPVNFLNPIDGTPLAGRQDLDPRYCLKVLAMFRFANPTREIRISGGRELHLGSLQPLGLYPANSIFVGDYLTTKGSAEADYQDDRRARLPDHPQRRASLGANCAV